MSEFSGRAPSPPPEFSGRSGANRRATNKKDSRSRREQAQRRGETMVDEKHVFGLESPFKFRLTLQCLIEMKVPTNDSQGKKQFPNKEGCCHEDGRNILVYESMMNGILKEDLHGNFSDPLW
ncbi:unnamed protein product [Triticum turgidum subsp. durum]|uniref:Uncharacterized protein n=2 Tax=Triticum TaxID=4564 RepID=A0A9R1QQN6_TRITD|nr:unnamed protein product [Triticum aestivum]VAH81553.1 unnamed protein product [Triticum turgidum subsp. durum]